MLLKALISRLNGGTNTRSTRAPSSYRRFSPLVYEKYPNLPVLLLRLLRIGQSRTMSCDVHSNEAAEKALQIERVFPALEIIEQSGIPSQDHEIIRQIIQEQLEGPSWQIRDKAAKTLALVLPEADIEHEMKKLLHSTWPSQNALHGRLLYTGYLVNRYIDLEGSASNLFPIIIECFGVMVTSNPCPLTRAKFLKMLADIFHSDCDQSWHCRPVSQDEQVWHTLPRLNPEASLQQDWQNLLEFLDLNHRVGPIYALEDAAMVSCEVAIKSIRRTNKPVRDSSITQEETVFDARKGSIKRPEQFEAALKASGSFLAGMISPSQSKKPTLNTEPDEKFTYWIRALRQAQDERAVSVL